MSICRCSRCSSRHRGLSLSARSGSRCPALSGSPGLSYHQAQPFFRAAASHHTRFRHRHDAPRPIVIPMTMAAARHGQIQVPIFPDCQIFPRSSRGRLSGPRPQTKHHSRTRRPAMMCARHSQTLRPAMMLPHHSLTLEPATMLPRRSQARRPAMMLHHHHRSQQQLRLASPKFPDWGSRIANSKSSGTSVTGEK